MSSLLKTKGLTKDFGNQKGAFDVNIDIGHGEIVGFIGPNGSGKTTTMSMITGFTKPTRGSFELLDNRGVDYTNIHNLMPKIGVMLSEVAFENDLTPREIFNRSQKLLGGNYTKNWEEMSGYFDLDLDVKFKKLSFGNRKKVGVINALLHEPEFVILDEPTSGLDPLVQQKFLDLIRHIQKSGGSVFLSSHVLHEVQTACDRIIMIKDGKIIVSDKTEDVLNQALKVFRVKNLATDKIEDMEENGLIKKWIDKGGETHLFAKDREPVLKYLVNNKLFEFYLEKPSLEDMFLENYD